METLSTFFFLGLAIIASLVTGIVGFVVVIFFGILVQMSMQRRRDERKLYEKIVQLEKSKGISQ